MFRKSHARKKSADREFTPQPPSTTFAVSPLPPSPAPPPRSRRQSMLTRLGHRDISASSEQSRVFAEKDGALPHEMVPVITLLGAQNSRVYTEGYFMLLPDLNGDGKPVSDRKWSEVFGVLQGTLLTMYDAKMLEQGRMETVHINIADGQLHNQITVDPGLTNVIVLSSTVKNRFLLQFGTKKLYHEWTAAIQLASFERRALQEAYTGALLSSKGSQLHGIRMLLSETRQPNEAWCEVRFGAGMPWRRVWAVVTPNVALKDKKERKTRHPYGKISLYAEMKDVKRRRPLATVTQVSSAFAVFPEKAVLVNISTLIKIECVVEFDDDTPSKETTMFFLPEVHPGIMGYETLIRFLIPLYDVFGLYGRPKRLNADKNDLHSLLFGMPTLPKAHYLDPLDMYMLAALPDSGAWTASEWAARTKELIASKMATGHHGTGNINADRSPDSSMRQLNAVPPVRGERPRAASEPHKAPPLFANPPKTPVESSHRFAPNVPSPLQHSRPAPRAPPSAKANGGQTSPKRDLGVAKPLPPQPKQPQPSLEHQPPLEHQQLPPVPQSISAIKPPETSADPAALAPPVRLQEHHRVKSEGQVAQHGLLSPKLADVDFENEQRSSFVSAVESVKELSVPPEAPRLPEAEELFDPSFKGGHMSYADYSEYMRQYIQNLSMQPKKPPKPAPLPKTGGVISAIESEDSDDAEDNLSESTTEFSPVAHRREPSPPYPNTQTREKARAQLLSTPMRTPEVSQLSFGPGAAASVALPEMTVPQSTSQPAPQIVAYPNAPGASPGPRLENGSSERVPLPAKQPQPTNQHPNYWGPGQHPLQTNPVNMYQAHPQPYQPQPQQIRPPQGHPPPMQPQPRPVQQPYQPQPYQPQPYQPQPYQPQPYQQQPYQQQSHAGIPTYPSHPAGPPRQMGPRPIPGQSAFPQYVQSTNHAFPNGAQAPGTGPANLPVMRPIGGSAKTGPAMRPLNEIRSEQLRAARAQALSDNF